MIEAPKSAPSRTSPQYNLLDLRWIGTHVAVATFILILVTKRLPDGKSAFQLLPAFIGALFVQAFCIIDQLINIQLFKAHPGKHFIHAHSGVLSRCAAVCLIAGAIAGTFLAGAIWQTGAGMVILMGLFLWLATRSGAKGYVHAFRVPLLASVYTTCIWTTSWNAAQSGKSILALVLLSAIAFFQQLLILAHLEALERSPVENLARKIGKKNCRILVYGCFMAAVLLGIWVCYKTDIRFQIRFAVVFAAMVVYQTFIFRQSGVSFSPRLRLLSELGLLLPVVLL